MENLKVLGSHETIGVDGQVVQVHTSPNGVTPVWRDNKTNNIVVEKDMVPQLHRYRYLGLKKVVTGPDGKLTLVA